MHIVYRKKEWTVEETCTVKQLLDRLELLPEAALVVRNGQLVTEDQRLDVSDEIKVVAVISGG